MEDIITREHAQACRFTDLERLIAMLVNKTRLDEVGEDDMEMLLEFHDKELTTCNLQLVQQRSKKGGKLRS